MSLSSSMMRWFETNPLRKIGLLLLVAVAGFAAFYSLHTFGNDGIDATRYRVYIDAETRKVFTVELKIGMTGPVLSPDTGKPTAYKAEACYWNADGTTKSTPTYVLLNGYVGKPGPTFCPDCGRLVVPNNRRPNGQSPPPTKDEYEKMYGPIKQ
jgi:hypothetical protein